MIGSDPPMATDCAIAKGLPAATLPKPDCITAAIDPTFTLSCPVIEDESCRGLPARGPADPKPNIPRIDGARTGARMAPNVALAATQKVLSFRPVAEPSAREDAG
jgi:hypothetical protein